MLIIIFTMITMKIISVGLVIIKIKIMTSILKSIVIITTLLMIILVYNNIINSNDNIIVIIILTDLI